MHPQPTSTLNAQTGPNDAQTCGYVWFGPLGMFIIIYVCAFLTWYPLFRWPYHWHRKVRKLRALRQTPGQNTNGGRSEEESRGRSWGQGFKAHLCLVLLNTRYVFTFIYYLFVFPTSKCLFSSRDYVYRMETTTTDYNERPLPLWQDNKGWHKQRTQGHMMRYAMQKNGPADVVGHRWVLSVFCSFYFLVTNDFL